MKTGLSEFTPPVIPGNDPESSLARHCEQSAAISVTLKAIKALTQGITAQAFPDCITG